MSDRFNRFNGIRPYIYLHDIGEDIIPDLNDSTLLKASVTHIKYNDLKSSIMMNVLFICNKKPSFIAEISYLIGLNTRITKIIVSKMIHAKMLYIVKKNDNEKVDIHVLKRILRVLDKF